MKNKLFQITYLVDDYDRAINFFTQILGFELQEDSVLSPEKRWVVINCNGTHLLLAKASNNQQQDAIGNQCGGRVGFFMECENFDKTFAHLCANNINFLESPRNEIYGKVAVFEDIYGNKWDLIERKNAI